MQFLGGRRTAYIFIATDRLVIRDMGIAGNRRIVQIRVTGYVEVRRIRCAADGLVAFDRGRTIGCGITFRFGVTTNRLIARRRRIALDGQVLVNRSRIRDV